jgi:hypothetical protein
MDPTSDPADSIAVREEKSNNPFFEENSIAG